jgi:Holliday junction resolvasome RuvABC endonuclease subunit
VDPGIAGSGWAVWEFSGWNDPHVPPIAHGVIEHLYGDMADRLEAYYRSFAKLVVEHGVSVLIVEWPEYFNSAKGFSAAARGDIFKLTGCATAAMAEAWSHDAYAAAIPVSKWKGQMPKDTVSRLVAKFLGRTYESHAGDAVGIGLYYKGAWKND